MRGLGGERGVGEKSFDCHGDREGVVSVHHPGASDVRKPFGYDFLIGRMAVLTTTPFFIWCIASQALRSRMLVITSQSYSGNSEVLSITSSSFFLFFCFFCFSLCP